MSSLTPPQFKVENPEFSYQHCPMFGLELELQISHAGEKWEPTSALTLNTSGISGYEMGVMIEKEDGTWTEPYRAPKIAVLINGEYERNTLIDALQKIGLMTLAVYGKRNLSNEE